MTKQLAFIIEKSRNIKKPILVLVFLLFLDAFVVAVSFSMNNVFRPDILAMAVYASLYIYLFLTKRKEDIPFLFISSIIAVTWTVFANDQYGYNKDMMNIYGLSAYPIFAWATGLAALYLIYTDIEQIIMKNGGILKRFVLFSGLYIFFIITFETIAYHIFDIKNMAASIYPGLPICNCIHAPHWMQISYFMIGPIYFIICTYYKIKMNIWNLTLKN